MHDASIIVCDADYRVCAHPRTRHTLIVLSDCVSLALAIFIEAKEIPAYQSTSDHIRPPSVIRRVKIRHRCVLKNKNLEFLKLFSHLPIVVTYATHFVRFDTVG